ncbi:hypothetical protein ACLIJS_02550 [Mammaliicoccus sciuri]|uniref:hypothetical protein n=1 Tax=Mammaliicoccus sciuri TaxID=1296 RepID=UPI003A950283
MNIEFQRFVKENKHKAIEIEDVILDALSEGISITYDDIYEMKERTRERNNKLMIPKVVSKFFSMMNQNKNLDILVAWDQYGEWLQSSDEFNKVVLLNKEEKQAKITSNLLAHENKKVIVTNPIRELENFSKKSFDVICGFPPLGIREVANINGIEFKGELSDLLLLKSIKLLKENGKVNFIVTEKFFSRNSRNSVISKLEHENVYLESALYLPSGSLSPITNIGTYLITLGKNKKEKIFVGELKEETRKVLFQNWESRKEGKVLQLGKLVKLEEFRSYNQIEKELEIERIVQRSNFQNIPADVVFVEINNIFSNELKDVKHKERSLYIPTIGLNDVVSKVEHMKINPKFYFQVVLKENVNVTYLCNWFNSNLGKLVRESMMTGISMRRINKSTLSRVVLYLPEHNTQENINEMQNKINEIKLELKEIENKVWNQPHKSQYLMKRLNNINKEDGFQEWIDTLPFPLASILYKYYATKDISYKKEFLLHFFEAFSQFQVMVMLSALTQKGNNINEKYLCEIEIDKLTRATFGSWVVIGRNMSKKLRNFMNDEPEHCLNLFKHRRKDLLNIISSKEIYNILEFTKKCRNDWRGHGGVESIEKAKERLNLLERELQNLRSFIGDVFDEYHLIQPGQGYFTEELFNCNCHILQGTRNTFIEKDYKFIKGLDVKYLYLYEEGNYEALKLLPFIKMMPSPNTQVNACYFYNRIDKDGVRMVSYYFDQDADVIIDDDGIPNLLETLENKKY